MQLNTLLAAVARAEQHRKQWLQAHWDQAFTPGQRLLCCGEWQRLTVLPHVCPHCHREYFVEKGSAA